ncbi:MAG: hypothetical protein K2K24_03290 [Clostridia bacterium]|nr:hypothetical protein [Clostridia bacterium]
MKDKLRSYEFWVAVISAVLVVLQTMSMKIDVPHVAEITMAFLGALSVAGILKKSKVDEEPAESTEDKEVDTDLNNVQGDKEDNEDIDKK